MKNATSVLSGKLEIARVAMGPLVNKRTIASCRRRLGGPGGGPGGLAARAAAPDDERGRWAGDQQRRGRPSHVQQPSEQVASASPTLPSSAPIASSSSSTPSTAM